MRLELDKNTVLESNGLTIMEFIEQLLNDKEDKTVILNSLSFNFSNSMSYIHDWRTKYRKRRIQEEYQKIKCSDLKQEEIYRNISHSLQREFSKENIDVKITPRVVRHAVESA